MSSQLAAKMDDQNSDDEEQDKKTVTIKKKDQSKVKEKTHTKNKKESSGKKIPRKAYEASEEGEVSSEEKEFDDGLDEDLMGNEADRDYLEGLTEKEREEVSFLLILRIVLRF